MYLPRRSVSDRAVTFEQGVVSQSRLDHGHMDRTGKTTLKKPPRTCGFVWYQGSTSLPGCCFPELILQSFPQQAQKPDGWVSPISQGVEVPRYLHLDINRLDIRLSI